jgi:preprotein translocase subunit SecE
VKSKANVMILKAGNQGERRFDWFKWLVTLALLFVGVFGNYYYSQIAMPIRMLGWLVVLSLAGLVAAQTQKGKWTIDFIRDSRLELRKVIWPTRQETVQTTMVVAAMVVILSLFLWGVDGVLVWIISWLTGQRS